MTTHVSAEQVRWWLDDGAITDVKTHSEPETEFNLQVTLSNLPLHLIKEDPADPIRIVGQSEFDTEHARALLHDEEERTELLEGIGPILASTPGFYTFLDEEGRACRLREAESLQLEHRIYPEEATQQALMDSVMAIATGMRFVQNVVAATHPGMQPDSEEAAAPGGDTDPVSTGGSETQREGEAESETQSEDEAQRGDDSQSRDGDQTADD